jgi:hypothetical protein
LRKSRGNSVDIGRALCKGIRARADGLLNSRPRNPKGAREAALRIDEFSGRARSRLTGLSGRAKLPKTTRTQLSQFTGVTGL